jgi:ketosteroid isomerase-like protein
MNADAHIRVVLEVFAAIEQRDAARFQAHTHPGVTICWPPSLPWNACVPGRPDEDGHHARSWLEVWAPLQPTAAERQMDPEVIAAADDRVVVQWRQRGRSPTGLCFDGQVLGVYEIRGSGWPAPRCSISTPMRSGASSPTPRANRRVAGCPGSRRLIPMVGDGGGRGP